jgi:putative endonuclease
VGRAGEALAEAYLTRAGCRAIARNFRCRVGEIDLVVVDGETIVFVEVRTRRGARCGTPLESVDGRKQARVGRVARYFLGLHGWGDRIVRFDVVGVRLDTDTPTIDHVRGAFDVVG